MEVLIGLVFLGASLAVAFVLPVVSFLRATQANQRSEALARELQALRAELQSLRASGSVAKPPVAEAPASGDAVPSVGPPPTPSVEAAIALGHSSPVPAVPFDSTSSDPVLSSGAAQDAGHQDSTSSVAASAAMPGAPATTSVLPGLPPAPGASTRPDTLEERIGARWLLYAGIGALILGVSYFIKFAFDNGWVSEPLRVAIGVLLGGGLVAGGQRFVQRGLAFFGHALSGGGLVMLYVALYAALHAYALIGPTTAFTGMLLVTLLGIGLADRHRVEVLAALALLGGFATPALVGGEGRQVVLFLYNALLLGGALLLVLRHAWAGVAVLAYVLAGVMTVAWIASSYTPAAGLRTLLLVTVHLALIAGIIVALRRQHERTALAYPASWLLLTAPVIYHCLALWLIGRAHGQLLVYLLLATVAGLSVSYHAGWRWARTLVLVLVAVPLVDWLGELVTPRWHTAGVVASFAIYLLHLAGQWRDLSDDDPGAAIPLAEYVHTHATGLFLPLALYAFLDNHAAWWNAPMLTGVAVWNLAIAGVLRLRMPALSGQFLALAGTLAAVAISEWFDGPVVAIGWALEAAAVGYAALRARNRWLERGSLVLFAGAAVKLVDALVSAMALGTWPIVNTRALATLVVVGAMTWLAARLADDAEAPWPHAMARHVLAIGANILVVGWISAEIGHVFGQRAYTASVAGLTADVARAELAQQVALSVAWALYAVGLVAAGFRRQYAPARYLAIALFGLTIVKVMTKDIAELDRVYQMLSVLAVGVLLVAASYLYQRVNAKADAGRD